jgi:hypothetical protein
MQKTILAIVALSFLAVVVAPAFAHHSFAAQYDSNKPVTLKGAVTKVEWQNPHTYFYIDVKDEKTGRISNWACEMGAPAVITRSGWTRNTLKIGDEIIVEGSLAKDGSNLANARRVKLASTGQVLGAGSSAGDYQQ